MQSWKLDPVQPVRRAWGFSETFLFNCMKSFIQISSVQVLSWTEIQPVRRESWDLVTFLTLRVIRNIDQYQTPRGSLPYQYLGSSHFLLKPWMIHNCNCNNIPSLFLREDWSEIATSHLFCWWVTHKKH